MGLTGEARTPAGSSLSLSPSPPLPRPRPAEPLVSDRLRRSALLAPTNGNARYPAPGSRAHSRGSCRRGPARAPRAASARAARGPSRRPAGAAAPGGAAAGARAPTSSAERRPRGSRPRSRHPPPERERLPGTAGKKGRRAGKKLCHEVTSACPGRAAASGVAPTRRGGRRAHARLWCEGVRSPLRASAVSYPQYVCALGAFGPRKCGAAPA